MADGRGKGGEGSESDQWILKDPARWVGPAALPTATSPTSSSASPRFFLFLCPSLNSCESLSLSAGQSRDNHGAEGSKSGPGRPCVSGREAGMG